MKRRRVVLGVLATLGLAVAAVAVTLWALEPAPGVTEENARRLREGMSRARVEAIMGRPGLPAGGGQLWEEGGLTVEAIFVNDALTEGAIWRDRLWERNIPPPAQLTILDRVRDFLGF